MTTSRRYYSTYKVRVQGIPALLEIQSFEADPAHDYYECTWGLKDRKGYPAGWLEDKLTETDREELDCKAWAFATGEAKEEW